MGTESNNNSFRNIPSVNTILQNTFLTPYIEEYGHEIVTYAIRKSISDFKNSPVLQIKEQSVLQTILDLTISNIKSLVDLKIKHVINATGIILHTNLGRAPLGKKMAGEMLSVIQGYCNIEFDLSKGDRGHRIDLVRSLIQYICKCEDVVVVNNNAAALILILSTLASGKEVIISRGELIEIGGSFRIPEIMAVSGAKMIEVGTTNRTRLADYEKAITSNTALIVKAHRSNFYLGGFTEETSLTQLAECAHKHNIPLIYDIGSGLLKKVGPIPTSEPDVKSSLGAGADIVCFSGDKLLGGPQAGIIVGRKRLISQFSKAPLMRALRIGKLTLAALAVACRQYLDEKQLIKNVPLFAFLNRSENDVLLLAQNLLKKLKEFGIPAEIIKSKAQIGGGSLPDLHLESYAVALLPPNENVKSREKFAEEWYHKLLMQEKPIVGILREGKILFDCFTLEESDLDSIANTINNLKRTV